MASELGYRFLDAKGAELEPGGRALVSLARIDAGAVLPELPSVRVVGACDVDNPLTGPSGASATFGPQKGASAEDVSVLDHALGHLAAVVHRDLGVAWNDEPGAGAAGGLGFGLLSFCGARLRPGVEVVMSAVGLQERIARADLVITGEGSFDEQSLRGKTPAGMLDAGRLVDVPVAIICGRASIAPEGVPVRSLVDAVGERSAMDDTRTALAGVAERLAEDVRELTGMPT
jgi:glycerate kinase